MILGKESLPVGLKLIQSLVNVCCSSVTGKHLVSGFFINNIVGFPLFFLRKL